MQRNGRIDRYGQKHTPYIDYLLTVPESPDVRGDLRILDRLIEKEEQVQKNLGDAAWLMNLHSTELEEEDVARAVQGDKSAEEVLPDDPRHDEGDDWFSEIFGGGAAEAEPRLEKAERVSLFASDLDFAREAFEVAVGDRDELVRWKPDLQGFDLAPPADLERRYEFLPPELTRQRDRFRLTVDRDRVMKAIEVARQKEGAWPEWELFWPQHPVCEWLDDRVLSELGRHQALVVSVPSGLEPDDALFLFQGIFSNRRSQTVLVDWFAVPFRADVPQPSVSWDEAIVRSGLRNVKGNPATKTVPAILPDLRQAAVAQAREHMHALRGQRAEQIAAPLRSGLRALSAWRDKSLDILKSERTLAAKAGKVPEPRRRRIEADERHVNAAFKERREWIDQGMRTVPEPYLRLAAVFIRSDLA